MKRWPLIGGIALVSAALAWLLMRPADTGVPVDAVAPTGGEADAQVRRTGDALQGTRTASDDGDTTPRDPRDAPSQADTPQGPADAAALEADLEADMHPADRRAARVERSVRLVLETVAPELAPEDVERECKRDGRTCTFEGPWPGDDFLARWVRAISGEEISSADLAGVTFDTFEPYEQDGAKRFRIVAVHPE